LECKSDLNKTLSAFNFTSNLVEGKWWFWQRKQMMDMMGEQELTQVCSKLLQGDTQMYLACLNKSDQEEEVDKCDSRFPKAANLFANMGSPPKSSTEVK